jgi:hypothetical protein
MALAVSFFYTGPLNHDDKVAAGFTAVGREVFRDSMRVSRGSSHPALNSLPPYVQPVGIVTDIKTANSNAGNESGILLGSVAKPDHSGLASETNMLHPCIYAIITSSCGG